MCFSAPASFAAAAIIVVAGGATLLQRPARSELAFAAIPLIFAAHQTIEGFIWLSVIKGESPPDVLVGAYLFIAKAWWPAYAPLSILLFERGRQRRQGLVALFLAGAVVSVHVSGQLLRQEYSVEAVANGLRYASGDVEDPVVGLYVLTTVAPFLMSRHRYVFAFGIAVLFGAVATELFFSHAGASAWCFFAAMASLFVFLHIRRSRNLARRSNR